MPFKTPASTRRPSEALPSRIPPSRIVLFGAVLFATLPFASAQAQSPARTGTGGGAASTVTAPNTSSVGQTVPRGGSDAQMERDLDRRTPQQVKDDEISKGICIGCNK